MNRNVKSILYLLGWVGLVIIWLPLVAIEKTTSLVKRITHKEDEREY